MKEFLNEFISYLKLVKKSSANTVDSYQRDLLQYMNYLEKNNINNPTTVSNETVSEYISSLSRSGKSASTVTRATSSIKAYYKFLNSINKRQDIPVLNVNTTTQAKSLPIILDLPEIQALLDQPDTGDIKGIRDKAMLETLYATGIKVSELISLTIEDVNLQVGFIKSGKGKNERIVPLHKGAIKILSLYINQIRPAIVSDFNNSILFTNMNGSVMTRQGFWKILKGYAKSAGIEKDITPHSIRHSFAYHMLENGADIEDIKDLLGHVDISSTQIYTQIIKSKYSKSYSKFHPLAR